MISQASITKTAWRLGRKLYCWARKDVENRPEINGEYWLLEHVIQQIDNGDVFFDVGANKGDWSVHAISIFSRRGVTPFVHAFEPCAGTRSVLVDRLKGDNTVTVHAAAISSEPGSAILYSSGAGLGTNSLSEVSGPSHEAVSVTTLDSFAKQHNIAKIVMIKVDVEGFDHSVLVGAGNLLARGAIEVLQFEYNWRWLINRASLRQVFEMIEQWPYRLGKLVPGGIQFFDKWHFELDRFFEGNYVLVRRGSRIESLGQRFEFDGSNVLILAKN